MKAIKQFFLRPWLYLIIFLLGTMLKFYKLNSRYYWIDEICTIQHTSGILERQYPDLIPINEIKNINYYHDLLHLNKQNYTIGKQFRGLATSPSLSPAHYALLIFWHRIAGDDYLDYRLFTIVCFVLAAFFLFLLTKTLFRSRLTAWIVVSLFSISPFIHVYIQEARYYILWVGLIALLNYLFLQAAKLNKPRWWILYSIIGILSLYTSFLSGLVIIGHLFYIFLLKKELRLNYFVYLVIILLFYLPWIYSIIVYKDEILNSLCWQIRTAGRQFFWEPIAWQLYGFAHIFVSMENHLWTCYELLRGNLPQDLIISLVFSILVVSLLLVMLIHFISKSAKSTLYFIALIFLPTVLFFYIMDIVRNGYLSPTWRYHLVNFTVIILIVSNYLSEKISVGKHLFTGIYIGLVILGIVSIFHISKFRCWSAFEKPCLQRIKEAQLFSNNEKPLLITNYAHWQGLNGFYGLITQCESENIDILRASSDIQNVKDMLTHKIYTDIYVVYASNELIQNLKSQFGERMESLEIEGISPIWQINLDENNFLDN